MATRIVGNNKRGAYSTWNDVENDDPNRILYFEEYFPLQQFTLTYPMYGDFKAYYYKYDDSFGSENAHPVLYLDVGGVPGEKLTLNEPLMNTAWENGDVEGWVSSSVTIKRMIPSGTTVWFGFYSFFLCPRYDIGNKYVYTSEYIYTLDEPVTNPPDFLSFAMQRNDMPKMDLSMYFTYSDEPLSVNYIREVQDSIHVLSMAFRSIGSNRNITTLVGIRETTHRIFGIRRFIESVASAVAIPFRHKGIRARVESVIEIIEHVRCSRGLIRFVQTTLGLWERITTKIGVHKIVHNFYTPIALDIELKENTLIKKIYKGQSALRMSMDCDVDLTGALQTEIVANKPDGTLIVLPAFILDADKGKIAYDVTDSSVLNISGWWRFTPLVTFSDNRSAPGIGINVFVYER